MINNFAISTSWNGIRLKNANAIIEEMLAAGFSNIEVYFKITQDTLDGISEYVQKKAITVSSVHNVCPIPEGIRPSEASPDYYSLSSFDINERKKAVNLTKMTIDTANMLKAKAVVLHCGKVDIEDTTRTLIKLYESDELKSEKFKKTRQRTLLNRAQLAPKHTQELLKSLDEINKYAVKKKISIGIENRFYIKEMPSFSEIDIILKEFKGSNIYYWHDCGHAQVLENLGIILHKDLLDNFSKNLLGIHLHDVKGCQDHLAPLKGNLDFNMLKPYINNSHIKVIEVNGQQSLEAVKNGR
ncbi:MAG: TIM barrel protein, partial [Candidatus Omnitrophota bacterium]